jgi:hypothetical protein
MPAAPKTVQESEACASWIMAAGDTAIERNADRDELWKLKSHVDQIEQKAIELCYAIELLPASEQQTALSIQASELYRSIKGK